MKNIVITGSTRGIGYAMAIEFLKSGCNVTFSGRSEHGLDAKLKELEPYKDHIQYVPCNVQDPKQLIHLYEEAEKRFGAVDYWINNAGQNAPHKYIHETDPQSTAAVINTNILGMIMGSQIAAERMLKQGFGQIWNMEGLGSNNMLQVKTILYGTTKHALTYFTRGLAKELKDTPIKIGRLSPGMMLTDFITKDPQGESSDVLLDKNFQFVFNNLGDRPETVAAFFIPRMLSNTKNDAHLVWLTNAKAALRMMTNPIKHRKLI